MSKSLLITLIVIASLLLSGYVYTRYSLKSSIKKSEERTGILTPEQDTLGGKNVSEADLRPLFIQKLQQLLKSASGGLYDLNVGDMKVDVLASNVTLHNVTVNKNSAVLNSLKNSNNLPENSFEFSFGSLVIDGINLDDALNSKKMDYKSIRLKNPVITIEQHRGGKIKKSGGTFTEQFLKEMEKLSIDNIVIEGGTVHIVDASNKNKTKKLNNLEVRMNDILLDETTRQDKSRFLFAKKAILTFENYTSKSSDGLYNFKIGNVTVKATDRSVVMNHLSYGSHLNKQQFSQRQKWAKELYNLKVNSMNITNVDWWTLMNGEDVSASQVSVRGANLSIYLDRSKSGQAKTNVVPSQSLMQLPIKLNLEKLNITGLDLSYEEYNPLSQKSGTITFGNVSLAASNISNTGSSPFKINASALFMHKIPMQAQFHFDMTKHRSGNFSATVKMNKSFEGALLNSFAPSMGLLKIENGTVNKLETSIKGTAANASGYLSLTYTDLKLSLLEKDQGETQLDKKSLKSIFANAFVIKKDNPSGNNAPRKVRAEYVRRPQGGFLNLIWKTILVGILKTIGAPEKIAYPS